jgi:DNA processing protein
MKEYPELLAMTKEAPPYLFLRGNISLLKENIVSVVGSRTASSEGIRKAYRLSKCLGRAGIVVASGLARGIDTAAHKASIENNYLTICVIETPITKVYPRENAELQKKISEVGLVVSQFPPSSPVQRWHFPMRNAVMSGISLATAIVEAGETSGALKQADYALKQNRLVFIPQSAFENNNISWPKKYIQRKGVFKFSKIEELLKMLEQAEIIPSKAGEPHHPNCRYGWSIHWLTYGFPKHYAPNRRMAW